MKVKKVERKETNYRIFVVTFEPNWLEKLFGVKEKQALYKMTTSQYMVGGGNVYLDEEGYQLGFFSSIGRAIDKFNRKF